jgi:hypothetical protein
MEDDARGRLLDRTHVVLRELDRRRAEVLFEPLHLRRPRNRDDPWLLGEQPSKCDLGGRESEGSGWLMVRDVGDRRGE